MVPTLRAAQEMGTLQIKELGVRRCYPLVPFARVAIFSTGLLSHSQMGTWLPKQGLNTTIKTKREKSRGFPFCFSRRGGRFGCKARHESSVGLHSAC